MLKDAQVAGLGSEEDGEAETGSENGDEEEWGGIKDPVPASALEPVDHEEEYIDEDLYTTVKVEAVSVDRDGLHNKAELEADEESDKESGKHGKTEAKAVGDKKARKDEPKKKKKKFRYGTKLERQLTNRKNNKGRNARS